MVFLALAVCAAASNCRYASGSSFRQLQPPPRLHACQLPFGIIAQHHGHQRPVRPGQPVRHPRIPPLRPQPLPQQTDQPARVLLVLLRRRPLCRGKHQRGIARSPQNQQRRIRLANPRAALRASDRVQRPAAQSLDQVGPLVGIHNQPNIGLKRVIAGGASRIGLLARRKRCGASAPPGTWDNDPCQPTLGRPGPCNIYQRMPHTIPQHTRTRNHKPAPLRLPRPSAPRHPLPQSQDPVSSRPNKKPAPATFPVASLALL